MTTINTSTTDLTLISATESTITTSTDMAVAEAETLEPEASGGAKADTVNISTRAQRIQQLNEEFFSGDPREFTVTSEFIQRLQEFELITAEEASSLGQTVSRDSLSDSSSVGELSLFIDSFTDTVKEIAPDNNIIGILQQAQSVLDNFNTPTPSSLDINIPQVIEQLQDYIGTEAQTLPASDQRDFEQLFLALEIADKLTPGTNTIAEINSYLAIDGL